MSGASGAVGASYVYRCTGGEPVVSKERVLLDEWVCYRLSIPVPLAHALHAHNCSCYQRTSDRHPVLQRDGAHRDWPLGCHTPSINGAPQPGHCVVVMIDLRDNQLKGPLLDSLGNLGQLQVLGLDPKSKSNPALHPNPP